MTESGSDKTQDSILRETAYPLLMLVALFIFAFGISQLTYVKSVMNPDSRITHAAKFWTK